MKVFIVVLVVLVALMVVGMLVGGGREGGSITSATKGWPEQIGKLLVKKERLASQDIQASFPSACLSQLRQGALVLAPGGSCQFAIKESRANVREITLGLQQGSSVNVHLQLYGDNELSSDIRLEPGESKSEKDVQFFRDGGALTVTCLQAGSGGQCRIAAR